MVGALSEAVTPTAGDAEDTDLVNALRRGDEPAFAALLGRYNASLVRLAMVYVRNRAVAEEVVQDTWLGVLNGIDRFEGRSSLKTWIFRILTNTAKTRAEREGRSVPFSSLGGADPSDSAVDPDRFLDSDHPRWPGHWGQAPSSWEGIPEQRLVSKETLAQVGAAISALVPTQQRVIILRDVEGWSSDEVCELLGVSEVNQRVLLHRARSSVRGELERYLADEG